METRRTVWAAGAAAALLALTGCEVPWSSTPEADRPEVRPGELEAASGSPCPQELPLGDDPSGHGFGVDQPAQELPTLLEPQDAWVCKYDSYDVGSASSGGRVLGWRLGGEPAPVAAGDLPALQDALDSLALAERDRPCPADLGPRWMVVFSHDGDLTGVVVDDYGCRDVRLTDDPHATPPGAEDQEGAVSGVLDGGAAVLDAVGVGRSS